MLWLCKPSSNPSKRGGGWGTMRRKWIAGTVSEGRTIVRYWAGKQNPDDSPTPDDAGPTSFPLLRRQHYRLLDHRQMRIARPSIHRPPVADLSPQVDDFPAQACDLLPQFADQRGELRSMIANENRRSGIQERGIHEGHALPNSPPSSQINVQQWTPPTTGWANVYRIPHLIPYAT
jgi:hypothetical protein